MARCYLTGVEIALEDAFMLNLSIAHRVMRDLRERLATLERLTAQLGEKDRVTVRYRQGSHTRDDRRVVSKSVAAALAEACADAELFLPFAEWRRRGRVLTLSGLRDHPDYSARLRALDESQLDLALSRAAAVLRRLRIGAALSPELRDAITAGVCVALSDKSPEEIEATLRTRSKLDDSLADLGVPAHVEPILRATLNAKPEDWGLAE